MTFENNDVYVVRSDFLIGDIDHKILTFLYQPLIGVESIGVYNTLWNELDHYKLQGEKGNVSKLSKILRMPLEKMEEVIKKSEAVGLLKTYVKKNGETQCFVFELHPPLSPKTFMDHDVLSHFLKNELSDSEFEEIVGLFQRKKINKNQYTELTHSFEKVYGSFNPEEVVYKKDTQLIGEKVNSNKVLRENAFSSKLVLRKLGGSGIVVPQSFVTDELLEAISNIAFVYNFNENQVVGLVADSYVEGEGIDLIKLREEARIAYSLKRSHSGPKILEKSKVYVSRDDELTELEKGFIKETPYERLRKYFNGGEPPLVDLNVIEEVLVDIKLPSEVLNVLIDYIMGSNDHKFTKNYVLKIAAEWKRVGISDVKQAMNQAKKEFEKRKEYIKLKEEKDKRERGEEKPTWVKEEGEGEELSEEDLRKQEEEIKRMLEED